MAESATSDDERGHFTLSAAQALLPAPGTHPRSAAAYQHGSMLLKLFAPRGHDPQSPHTRDELYFVACGSGWFVNGERRHRFETGDVLFVAAGVAHRFEDFSDDLCVWVVFYGPEGGERKKESPAQQAGEGRL